MSLGRIKEVEAKTLSIPLRSSLRHGEGSHPKRFVITLTRVVSEDGEEGFGEVGGGRVLLRGPVETRFQGASEGGIAEL